MIEAYQLLVVDAAVTAAAAAVATAAAAAAVEEEEEEKKVWPDLVDSHWQTCFGRQKLPVDIYGITSIRIDYNQSGSGRCYGRCERGAIRCPFSVDFLFLT